MQRRKVAGGFELGEDLRRDFLMLGEFGSAVDDAMADRGGRCKAMGFELLGDELERVGLIVDRVGLIVEVLAIGGSQREFTAVGANAFGGACGDGADV